MPYRIKLENMGQQLSLFQRLVHHGLGDLNPEELALVADRQSTCGMVDDIYLQEDARFLLGCFEASHG